MRLLIAITALISTSALAQTFTAPLVVDQSTAQQHVLHQVAPDYPPIAIAAHIYGDVKLQADINPQGHVVGILPIQGPAMLIGAATDAGMLREYTPFQRDGQP